MYKVRETSEWTYSIDKIKDWKLINIEWSNLKFDNLKIWDVQLLVDEVVQKSMIAVNWGWESGWQWPWEVSEIVEKVKNLYNEKFWIIMNDEDWLELFDIETSETNKQVYQLQEWLDELSQEEIEDVVNLWEKFLPWKKLTICWSSWEGYSWKVVKVVDENWNAYAIKRISEDKIKYNNVDEISIQNFLADYWISPRVYTWSNWEIMQKINNWNAWLMMDYLDITCDYYPDDKEQIVKVRDKMREFHVAIQWLKWLKKYQELWWWVEKFSDMLERNVWNEYLKDVYTEENVNFMRTFFREALKLEKEYPIWVVHWDCHFENFMFNDKWDCFAIDYPDISQYSIIIDAGLLAKNSLWIKNSDWEIEIEKAKLSRSLYWEDEKSIQDAAVWWFYMLCRYRASSLDVATKKFNDWEMTEEKYLSKIKENIQYLEEIKEMYRDDCILKKENLV